MEPSLAALLAQDRRLACLVFAVSLALALLGLLTLDFALVSLAGLVLQVGVVFFVGLGNCQYIKNQIFIYSLVLQDNNCFQYLFAFNRFLVFQFTFISIKMTDDISIQQHIKYNVENSNKHSSISYKIFLLNMLRLTRNRICINITKIYYYYINHTFIQ
ncbi:Transmembrane domain-containing protein [Spironucleus salmonicida]|nr:Transmembrane domain-containing protein [Spironucleus salmonicida]